MKKFFVFLMCLSLVVLVSCGGSGDSGGKEAESGSEESPDEKEESGSAENSGSEESDSACITSEKYGITYSKKTILDSCASKMASAIHPGCSWQESEESVKKRIDDIGKLQIVFYETENPQCFYPVENEWRKCPAFLPEYLQINRISGCEVYSIVPESDCIAPCADIYFWTGNYMFPTIYVGAETEGGDFARSFRFDGTASITADFKLGRSQATILWTESEKGIETERKAVATIRIEEEEIPDVECFWSGKDLRCN